MYTIGMVIMEIVILVLFQVSTGDSDLEPFANVRLTAGRADIGCIERGRKTNDILHHGAG